MSAASFCIHIAGVSPLDPKRPALSSHWGRAELWEGAANGNFLFSQAWLASLSCDSCYSAVIFLGFDFYGVLMRKSKPKENAAKIDYSPAVG